MYGFTIKYLRNAKGITQSKIASACGINQGTYSKFENNQTDLGGTTLLEVLKVLDISLQEFHFLHSEHKFLNQEVIISRFFNSPYNNEKLLTEIQLQITQLLKEKNASSTLLDIYILCDALLLILKDNNFEHAKQLVQPIWDRLSNNNELFLYDIYLMNAILFFFKFDEILKIKDFLERNIQKYIDFPNVKRLYINIKLNIGAICIENQKYEKGLAIIDTAIKPAKESNAYIQLAIAYIRKGICLKLQRSTEGEIWIQKGTKILEAVEEYETLELINKEISSYCE